MWLTGGSQNATDTYAYDAWGNPTSQSGTLANPFEYTGSVYSLDVKRRVTRATSSDVPKGGIGCVPTIGSSASAATRQCASTGSGLAFRMARGEVAWSSAEDIPHISWDEVA